MANAELSPVAKSVNHLLEEGNGVTAIFKEKLDIIHQRRFNQMNPNNCTLLSPLFIVFSFQIILTILLISFKDFSFSS